MAYGFYGLYGLIINPSVISEKVRRKEKIRKIRIIRRKKEI